MIKVLILLCIFFASITANAAWDGATNFPTSADDSTSLVDAETSGTITNETHDASAQAIIAIEAKIGTGASTPTTGKVFLGTGTGASGWGDLTDSLIPDTLTVGASGTVNDAAIPSGISRDTEITYESLNSNGDVGTSAGQLSIGDHTHSGVYQPASAYIVALTPRASQPTEAEVPIGMPCVALISSWNPNSYAGGNNYEVFRTGASTWINIRDMVTGKFLVNQEAMPFVACVNPQDVYDNDSTNHVLVLDHYTSAAQTITAIRIDCGLDPTTEPTLTFQYKAAGIGYGTPTTIEAVTTAVGVANVTTGIDDATIPAGSKVFVTFSDPDNAILVLSIKVELTKD